MMIKLKGDPLLWLLESENPSVRYWTLVDLLDRPVDDCEVQQARTAIMQQPLVKEIFALQHPEGYWGEDETKPYTAEGAVGSLSLLHMFGVPPDTCTSSGCNSFLANCQHECGGYSLVRKTRSGIFPCTTGQHLPFLHYFGFGDDPRFKAAYSFLIETMSEDKAFYCSRYEHRECYWGMIAVLNGFTLLPADIQSAGSKKLVASLANTLLDAPFDFNGEHKRWLTLGVPRAWDLLSMLKVLAVHGYANDPRFKSLLNIFLSLQDEQGRWTCGSVSRTWPLEKRNRPSKWVTLDALRMLKFVD